MTWRTVASIQPPFLEKKSLEGNQTVIDRGFELLEEALRMGAQYCCLPEFFNVFGAPESVWAEAASANWQALLATTEGLAVKYAANIVLPMLVIDQGVAYDRAYYVDSNGRSERYYDKVHPTIGERQSMKIAAGDLLSVFDTPDGRVAVAICYDVYFPELFSAIALQDPDIIFLPSLQRSEHELASEALMRARAMDSQAYMVRSSYGSPASQPWKPGMIFGQSCILHPDGTMLANAGHYEGFAIARVDLSFEWRRQRCGGYPSMSVRAFLREDRRPDVYERKL